MRAFPLAAAVLALVGCGRRDGGPARGAKATAAPAADPWAAPAAAPTRCAPQPFASSIPLAEASGGALLDAGGKTALFVVGDSGNDGAYELLDPDTGAVREDGKLPLGGPGDDLEGAAVTRDAGGERLWGLTSGGWLRSWVRRGDGFVLERGPVSIDGGQCAQASVNCGANYEGLCLVPGGVAPGACAGFAASKRTGRLICLTFDAAGAPHLDPARTIAVAAPRVLADCSFTPDGRTLLVGANGFGADLVARIDGWQDPAHARVVRIASLGPGFAEVGVAAPGGVVYRFSDLGGAPSLAGKFRCAGDGR